MHTPELLRVLRHRQFRHIYASTVVSTVGDWIGVLALTLAMLEVTGSVGASTLIPAALLAPAVGPGIWLTGWLDARLPRRTVMIATDVLRAAVVGAVVLVPLSPAVLVACAFTLGLLSSPFDAARAAVTPDAVGEYDYGTAMALANVTHALTIVVGYTVGGVAVATLGTDTTLLLDAGTYLVSAVVLARLQVGRDVALADVAGRSVRAAVGLLRSPGVLRTAAVLAVACSGLRGLNSLAAPWGQLLGGEQVAGLLAASVGVGSMLASMLAPSKGDTQRLTRIAVVLLLGGALLPLPLLVADRSVWAVGGAMVLSGAGLGALVPLSTVFGTALPSHLRATGFAVVLGAIRATSGLAPAVAGPVAEHTSLVAAGSLFAVAAVAATGWVAWDRSWQRPPAAAEVAS